ncbi:MAG: cytidine deaminase [Bacilli bacterium]|nr:cytidine deaminase [Bacilli bacterium]
MIKDILKDLLKNSYSPYSKYQVACVIKAKDGKLFYGVNVENKSSKDGLCAEQVAISSAVSSGYKRSDLDSIYIMGLGEKIIVPCFLCRQLLNEFFDRETIIYCYNNDKEEKQFKIKDLCPYDFNNDFLNDGKNI